VIVQDISKKAYGAAQNSVKQHQAVLTIRFWGAENGGIASTAAERTYVREQRSIAILPFAGRQNLIVNSLR
jgi:hypothetical protein